MNQHVDSWPFVSVVIPVRNEAGFIADLIGAILKQDYLPDRVEVIVADGKSTDGTREILASLAGGAPSAGRRRESGPHRVDRPEYRRGAIQRGHHHTNRRPCVDRDGLHSSRMWRCWRRIRRPGLWADRSSMSLRQRSETPWLLPCRIRSAWVTPGIVTPGSRGTSRARNSRRSGDGCSIASACSTSGSCETRTTSSTTGFGARAARSSYRRGCNIHISCASVSDSCSSSTFSTASGGSRSSRNMDVRRRSVRWRPLFSTRPAWFSPWRGCGGASPSWRSHCRSRMPRRWGWQVLPRSVRTVFGVSMYLPVAIATMHAGYALGLGYGIWARFFHAGAWDAQGKMAAISR